MSHICVPHIILYVSHMCVLLVYTHIIMYQGDDVKRVCDCEYLCVNVWCVSVCIWGLTCVVLCVYGCLCEFVTFCVIYLTSYVIPAKTTTGSDI